jgi:DNA polymerase-3 subunit delta'
VTPTEPSASSGHPGGGPPGDDLAEAAGVVGQAAAWRALAALATRPAHAVLLVGAAELGAGQLARAYAAAVLCPAGGCGHCGTCRRVLAGSHPDLTEVERTGPALRADEARQVVVAAQRRPLEAERQVLVVLDVHLAPSVVPVLLKTVEEPPETTVLVLGVEALSEAVATLASRCAQVPLRPVPEAELEAWLVGRGVEPGQAAAAARAAQGRPGRAEVLAADPALGARREMWAAVPGRLDGRGAVAAELAAELVGAVEAAVGVLAERQAEELDRELARAAELGDTVAGLRRQLEERHRRAQRRWRQAEWQTGLAVLAGVYRDRILRAGGEPGSWSSRRRAAEAFELVEQAAAALVRNPNEQLLLEALFVRLGRLS